MTWDPNSIAGLLIDINPGVSASVTQVSGKVTIVADQSGTGDPLKNMTLNDPIGNAGLLPTLGTAVAAYGGVDVLDFTAGNNRRMHTGNWATPVTTPITYFFVGNGTVDGIFMNSERLTGTLENTDYTGSVLYDSSGKAVFTSDIFGSRLDITSTGSPPLLSSPSIICATENAGASAVYVNAVNTTLCSGTLGTETTYGLSIGCWNISNFGFKGKMARLLAYSGALSLADRTTVMSRMQDAYGIPVTGYVPGTTPVNITFTAPMLVGASATITGVGNVTAAAPIAMGATATLIGPAPLTFTAPMRMTLAGQTVQNELTRPIHIRRYGAIDQSLPVPCPLGSTVTVYTGSIALLRDGFLANAASPEATDTCTGIIGGAAGGGEASPEDGFTGNGTQGAHGVWIECLTGTFLIQNGTGIDELTQADEGSLVYVISESVVGRTDGGGTRPVAGWLLHIDLSIPHGFVPIKMQGSQ